jgi:hypothetical protein
MGARAPRTHARERGGVRLRQNSKRDGGEMAARWRRGCGTVR